MTDLAPDELRHMARHARALPETVRLDPDEIETAADAWTEDRITIANLKDEVRELDEERGRIRKRLEAAESVRHAAQAYLNWHRRSFADPSCAADILNEELEGDRLGDALVAAFAGKETK